MKQMLFFGLIMLQTAVFSQTKVINGTYQFNFEGSNGSFSETIILNPDGSFNIHTMRKLDGTNPPESNAYGKGKWEMNKENIHFIAHKSDFDSKFTLNLNNTQARFNSKSPRDKSNRDIPTSIKIIKSDISWLVGRELKKQ